MKTKLSILATLGLLGIALLMFSGCYTQIATREDDQAQYSQQGYGNDSSYAAGDDSGVGCCNQWDDYHQQAMTGFSYYYPSTMWPSVAFDAAFYSPWIFDPFWGYDPWYYPYPYAYLGYGHYHSGYYPYSYNHSYYGGYVANRRTFGSTRGATVQAGGPEGRTAVEPRTEGSQAQQIDRGGYNLSSGASFSRPTGSGSARSQNAVSATRSAGAQRSVSGPTPNRSVGASGSRGSATRAGAAAPRQTKSAGNGGRAPRRTSGSARPQSMPSSHFGGGGGRMGGGGGRSGGGGSHGGRR